MLTATSLSQEPIYRITCRTKLTCKSKLCSKHVVSLLQASPVSSMGPAVSRHQMSSHSYIAHTCTRAITDGQRQCHVNIQLTWTGLRWTKLTTSHT